MSRIDDALRRAGGRFSAPPEPITAVAQLTSSGATTLDDYPLENDGRSVIAPGTAHLERRVVRPHAVTPSSYGISASDRKLVVSGNAAPVAVEQYRRLAAALHDRQEEQGLKALMITSALPAEGKTLTVVNLALTLSESYGRSVLLIDADLRRPRVHEAFKLPNTNGLSDSLRHGREVPLLEVSDHLSVLPAGRSDQPMAGLTSPRMRALLEQVTAAFDWVLLDAAPIGFIPDAQLLASLTRAVLFVIEAEVTPFQLVSRAIAQIDSAYIVGAVLNGASNHNVPAAGYYGEYYASPATRGHDR